MARTAETGSRSGRATRWPAAPGREGSAIARLFPNQALLDVLAILLLHPEEEFYQREIALKTGRTLVEAQRALRRIEDAGLLRARTSSPPATRRSRCARVRPRPPGS